MDQGDTDGLEYICLDPDTGSLLEAYADDDLTLEEKSRFDKHLEYCVFCREELALHRGVEEMLISKWPDLSPGHQPVAADTDDRSTNDHIPAKPPAPFNRFRVPVLVPLLLAAGIAFALIIKPPWQNDEIPVWRGLGRLECPISLTTRAGEPTATYEIKGGTIVNFPLDTVPLSGWPLILVIVREGEQYGEAPLLEGGFKNDEGFPVCVVNFHHEFEAGRYNGYILSGEGQERVKEISIIIRAP